jgi:hypothetical protein
MLAAVKQVVGRRFVSELKVWELPGTAEDVHHQLEISGYALEGGDPIAPLPTTATSSPTAGSGGDRIRIMVADQRLAVVGGTFQEMLEAVKALPGRRFDSQNKVWQVQGEVGIIKNLIEGAGFQLEGSENVAPGVASPSKASATSTAPSAPPYLEAPPDFLDDDPNSEMDDMMPPDWWDDERMAPPLAPPDDWDRMDYSEEPNPFDAVPPATNPPAPTTAQGGGGDRIRIRLGDIPLVVSGGSFQEMLAAVKKIPGRRFNGQDKIWEIPEDVTFDSINQTLSAAGFMVMPG